MIIFRTLPDALRNRFEPCEFMPDGRFVLGRTPAGWALAVVGEK
jgi:hypothetical protein